MKMESGESSSFSSRLSRLVTRNREQYHTRAAETARTEKVKASKKQEKQTLEGRLSHHPSSVWFPPAWRGQGERSMKMESGESSSFSSRLPRFVTRNREQYHKRAAETARAKKVKASKKQAKHVKCIFQLRKKGKTHALLDHVVLPR